MTTRRCFLRATGAAFAAAWLSPAGAQARTAVMVHSAPGCGCCHKWVDHMRASGFSVASVLSDEMGAIKDRLGVPEAMRSCHTATVGGYVIEGHVPAADVKRLLREKPLVRGLAVPGMVAGSPGMEGAAAQPYATLAFDGAGSRVYARH
jgi:hypothetical protein